MGKSNKKPQRVDPKLLSDLKAIARIRIEKGLAQPHPRDISIPELTRLLTRTEGYQMSLMELKTKPKRK
jgi:hypothetical protein